MLIVVQAQLYSKYGRSPEVLTLWAKSAHDVKIENIIFLFRKTPFIEVDQESGPLKIYMTQLFDSDFVNYLPIIYTKINKYTECISNCTEYTTL